MKNIKNLASRKAVAALIGGLATTMYAGAVPVTVQDVTDWGTTPMEIVNANLPYLGYDGGVYAGINTLAVTLNGTTTTYSGFCMDPFHWSLDGTISGYNEVPLTQGPKAPATLNAITATHIEDLWQEYYSPTMSSSSAAGLQIAIWTLVSQNAVTNDGLPANEAFSLPNGQNDFGAGADIASLATYNGPAANLIGLTGPGQDYVISSGNPPIPPQQVPDGGVTFMMLALALGILVATRSALPKLMPVKCSLPGRG